MRRCRRERTKLINGGGREEMGARMANRWGEEKGLEDQKLISSLHASLPYISTCVASIQVGIV